MSENVVLVIITALVSGLLATVITIVWQRAFERKRKKLDILETLMAYRYLISAQESVNALNSVEVVFHSDPDVRKAYADFLSATSKNPVNGNEVDEKHLRLLEEISKTVGLKSIRWDDIKHYYYPTGLARQIDEEATLRYQQIEINRRNLEKAQEDKNSHTE